MESLTVAVSFISLLLTSDKKSSTSIESDSSFVVVAASKSAVVTVSAILYVTVNLIVSLTVQVSFISLLLTSDKKSSTSKESDSKDTATVNDTITFTVT